MHSMYIKNKVAELRYISYTAIQTRISSKNSLSSFAKKKNKKPLYMTHMSK